MHFTVFSVLPVLTFNSSCDFISSSVLVKQYVKTNKKQQICNECFPIACSHINRTGIIFLPFLSIRLIGYASQHLSIAICIEMKVNYT